MTHCPICGQPVSSSGAFSLCSDCRGQIISLSPGDPRYIWYMRAVRAFYFDRMNFIYCCQSSRLKKCAPERR